jgi:hypothetical protein
MNTTFAPHLFVKNISKNVSKQHIHDIFQNCGFGVITDIIVKQRNGTAIIIYEKWNMEETLTTRSMLESGKSLTIQCDELNAEWKVTAYKKNRERFEHLFVDSKLHPNITDNRKERAKKNNRWVDTRCYAPSKAVRDENQRYAEEFLRDISVKLF